MGLFSKEKGWDCRPNPDGSQTCRRFMADKNGKVATGTEITIGADPKNGCQPYFTGDVNSILDEEADEVDKIARKVTAGCRRGMG